MFSRSSKALLLAFAGLILTGCSTTPEFQATFESRGAQTPPVDLQGSGEPGDMTLYHKDQKVQVGDTWTDTPRIFPKPRDAYDIHELPYAFSNKFEARGWETADGEGFGVILDDNKIMGALYQLEHAHDDLAQGFERDEISGMYPLHPKLIESGALKYWFWNSKDQTAMMCEFTTKDGINFTMAVGDRNVMKALGVSEDDAKKQIAEVEHYDEQSQDPKAKGA